MPIERSTVRARASAGSLSPRWFVSVEIDR
jgi:hypothetical protein